MKTNKTFQEFVDELMCKQTDPYDSLKDARPYHTYNAIENFVSNDIYEEMKGSRWYQEHRSNIEVIIANAIVRTLYYQELAKEADEQRQALQKLIEV